ncbi:MULTISPECIES: single-stranded DNA-binding protein [unclassified Nocardioides]|uniref:single-stranded DNA-binding protein n=1 Tax=unclassified Nocardioides TaxID=2615069 RepID=UPI0009EF84ED|nr:MULTISPECIES: single-stranded DNA-binding protein [unclassified Nocardioides]GAW52274.1 Single-stranded DNA-binding protein [Nocardioides sp. PD653-B2]GAW56041.1 Single-stranded DNA-binding protein [Nocardioides sp. PD653]
MNETTVTLQGWLGSDVTVRQAGDVPVAAFRVAATPRRYSRKTGSWEDSPTQWYSVSAWRGLADNCAGSLRRGDPVVVHGRLTVSVWLNAQGIEVTSFEVDATMVGHDLSRGTSRFTRTPKPQPVDETTDTDRSEEVAA